MEQQTSGYGQLCKQKGRKSSTSIAASLEGTARECYGANVEIKLSEVDFSNTAADEVYLVSINQYGGPLNDALSQIA